MEKKTSVFSNGLIWFGAGVSIAEILTGTYLAPLGIWQGAGRHPAGACDWLRPALFSGRPDWRIYGKERNGNRENEFWGTAAAFCLSCLNVLQLVGWTAIMIYDGALAARTASLAQAGGAGAWSSAALITDLDSRSASQNLGKVNTIAMASAFHPDPCPVP